MLNRSSLSEGDTLSVKTTKEEGEIILHHELASEFILSSALDLTEGETKTYDYAITKTIHSPTGELDKICLSIKADDSSNSNSSHNKRNSRSSKSSKSKGSKSKASRSKSRSSSKRQSASQPKLGRRKKSLREIGKELIGRRTFEVTDDEESMISSAKRKAKHHGRDPAIDPQLRKSE